MKPTKPQLLAIQAFKARHGRYWKAALSHCWLSGTDAHQPDGPLLRQVRNAHGPEWLYSYERRAP